MSLRLKIAAAMAALAGVIAALAASGAYVTAARQLDHSIDDTLVMRANAAVTRQGPDGRRRPGGDRDGDNGLFGAGARANCPASPDLQSLRAAQVIIDGEVQPCVSGGATITPTANDLAIAAGTPSESTSEGAGQLYHLSTTTVDGEPARVITMAFPSGGAIQLARDTEEANRVLEALRVRLVLIALAGIVAAAGVGFVLATRIVRPIRRLTTTAEHIAATRDLTTPVPPAGTDEIGSLSASFTTMVSSLAESQEQQQRLISDASHEMRTPLTSLRTNLELLARAEQPGAGILGADDRRAVIDDLQFETGELTSLLTELVELATDRAGGEPTEDVVLLELCGAVADRARRRTGRRIEVFQLDEDAVAGQPPTISVRQHMIERAVSNLIDNAVKYSPDPAPIEVIVGRSSVEVRDHGPGIAVEDLPHVFDRFYRATSARTSPGSGLGLAIVSQIVETHGGRVNAANHDDGAVVGFDLEPAPS